MVMADLIGDPPEFVVAVGDLIALFRMGPQDLPFLVRKLARFIQDLQGDSDLADMATEKMKEINEKKAKILSLLKKEEVLKDF